MHINIEENVILIRPTRLYYKGISSKELYEITRGIWKLADRREKADYVFAVIEMKIVATYRVHTWHGAMETEYSIRKDLYALNQEEIRNRFEFLGEVDPDLQTKYVGKHIGDYFSRGNANPVMYVNC